MEDEASVPHSHRDWMLRQKSKSLGKLTSSQNKGPAFFRLLCENDDANGYFEHLKFSSPSTRLRPFTTLCFDNDSPGELRTLVHLQLTPHSAVVKRRSPDKWQGFITEPIKPRKSLMIIMFCSRL